jgi:hypothetical protein
MAMALAPDLGDLQGVELYYNSAITPWFHLTADVQFVEPSDSRRDTAVVWGLPGKIDIECACTESGMALCGLVVSS